MKPLQIFEQLVKTGFHIIRENSKDLQQEIKAFWATWYLLDHKLQYQPPSLASLLHSWFCARTSRFLYVEFIIKLIPWICEMENYYLSGVVGVSGAFRAASPRRYKSL